MIPRSQPTSYIFSPPEYSMVPWDHPALYFLPKVHGPSGSCNIIYSPNEQWFPGVMQHSNFLSAIVSCGYASLYSFFKL